MAATAPSPLPPRRRLRPRGGEAKPKLGAVPRGAGLSRDAAVTMAQARVVGPRVLLVTQARHWQAAVVRVGVPLLSPAREHVCGAPPPAAQLAHLVVRCVARTPYYSLLSYYQPRRAHALTTYNLLRTAHLGAQHALTTYYRLLTTYYSRLPTYLGAQHALARRMHVEPPARRARGGGGEAEAARQVGEGGGEGLVGVRVGARVRVKVRVRFGQRRRRGRPEYKGVQAGYLGLQAAVGRR
eukprot:scaffold120993_cov72-Phaeocystis_antarctica.AAC.2